MPYPPRPPEAALPTTFLQKRHALCSSPAVRIWRAADNYICRCYLGFLFFDEVDERPQRRGHEAPAGVVEERPGEALPPGFEHRLQRAAVEVRAQPVLEEVDDAGARRCAASTARSVAAPSRTSSGPVGSTRTTSPSRSNSQGGIAPLREAAAQAGMVAAGRADARAARGARGRRARRRWRSAGRAGRSARRSCPAPAARRSGCRRRSPPPARRRSCPRRSPPGGCRDRRRGTAARCAAAPAAPR